MKNQQVVIDYWTMIQTSCIYLVLVFCGWIFIRLVHAIFWLPKHLQRNQENLQKLQKYLDRKLEIAGDKKMENTNKNNEINDNLDNSIINYINDEINVCNKEENTAGDTISSSATNHYEEITNKEENLLIKKDK